MAAADTGKVQELHDQAVARGDDMYPDPDTGLWVMTGLGLRRRGHCCGNGCRHCPWVGTLEEHPERILRATN